MKSLNMTLLGGACAAAVCLLTSAPSFAQMDNSNAPVVASDHGDWTLKQREDWLNNRLDKAHDDGALDNHEYDRVRRDLHKIHDDEDRFRGHHDGQLTDNETADLEARLNGVADQIHWLHEDSFQRPW